MAIQVIVAFIVILVLYIVTLSVLNIDGLVKSVSLELKQKDIVNILDGYGTPSFLRQLRYNTVNPYTSNYKRVAKSINSTGGASFTYQFWIKIDEADDTLYKDLVLLLKGDDRLYNAVYYKQERPGSANYTYIGSEEGRHINCPMISFGNSYREFKVRFNTNNRVSNEVSISMNPSGSATSRKNLLSLLPLNWAMVTFVFEDNYSIMENSENGIKFTFYFNDVPYWSASASSDPQIIQRNDTLKQNDGDLHVMPGLANTTSVMSDFMKMGNIKYYNYAVTSDEVRSAYALGPPSFPAKRDEKVEAKPAFIGAMNKIDIYNY